MWPDLPTSSIASQSSSLPSLMRGKGRNLLMEFCHQFSWNIYSSLWHPIGAWLFNRKHRFLYLATTDAPSDTFFLTRSYLSYPLLSKGIALFQNNAWTKKELLKGLLTWRDKETQCQRLFKSSGITGRLAAFWVHQKRTGLGKELPQAAKGLNICEG